MITCCMILFVSFKYIYTGNNNIHLTMIHIDHRCFQACLANAFEGVSMSGAGGRNREGK